jgi:hypothetical protein
MVGGGGGVTGSPLWLLLLVRLGVYIVNLCTSYFYNIIGKLTVFLQFQGFTHRLTLTLSIHNKQQVSGKNTRCFFSIPLFWVVNLVQSFQVPCINNFFFLHYYLFIPAQKSNSPFGLWSLETILCFLEDPSSLNFSLSSHRHSYISLLFNSRFITS